MAELPIGMGGFCKRVIREPLLWVGSIVWTVLADLDGVLERLLKPNIGIEHWRWLEKHMVSQSWSFSVWLNGILLLLLIAVVKTSYHLYSQARLRMVEAIADFENYKTRQLKLTWNPQEEPYRWWDMNQKPAPALYFRLCVKNISGVTVNGIKVELSELIPRELPCVPCPIRLMNNILPRDAPEREFSLNPGDKRFIDLMLQSRSMDTFWILHTVQGISEVVPIKPYKMVIRISAINVPEIVRHYELLEDGEMWRLQEGN